MKENKKPGHAPMDDFNLAVETVRLYTEAFQSFIDDVNSSGIDTRIITKETCQKILEAGVKRKELTRRIEIAKSEMLTPHGGTH